MAHEGGHIYQHIRREPNMHRLCVKAPDIEGVWTDRRAKVQYALSAREHVVTRRLDIAANFVCANSLMKDESDCLIPARERPASIFDKFIEQLKRYRQIDSEVMDPNTIMRTGVSGVADRFGKVQAAARDDIAFTFTMALGVVDKLRQGRFKYVNRSWLPSG